MSGGGWKDPLYKIVKQDSRNAAWLGNAVGWQGLEDEGKYNVKNPGHAVTKAAEYAAASYLAGLLGGGEAAAGAATPVVDESAGLLMTTGGNTAANLAEQQAMQQALQQAAPVTDLSINTVPVVDKSVQAGLLDKARLAFTSGSGAGKGGMLAQQLGLKMMAPQGQPQAPMAPPPQQGNMGPLANPYGTPAGNSLGINAATLTEEQKRMLRAKGIRI